MTVLGNVTIRNEGIYRLRAMEMLQMKVRGMGDVAIGKEFGVSDQTVQRSLAYAAREGLVKQYENQLISDLIPEAIRVYKAKLTEENDPYVAKDIIDNLIKLGDRFQLQEAKQEEMTLSAYLDSKQQGKKSDGEKSVKAKYSSASVIDIAPGVATAVESEKQTEIGPDVNLVVVSSEDADGGESPSDGEVVE